MTSWEYRKAVFGELAALGAAGWRVVPVPPLVTMTQTALGGIQAGDPVYLMEREAVPFGITLPLLAADSAAQ